MCAEVIKFPKKKRSVDWPKAIEGIELSLQSLGVAYAALNARKGGDEYAITPQIIRLKILLTRLKAEAAEDEDD